MKTFMSSPKGVSPHRQDLKPHAHANLKDAGARKRPA
jgi:hypothetical protein